MQLERIKDPFRRQASDIPVFVTNEATSSVVMKA